MTRLGRHGAEGRVQAWHGWERSGRHGSTRHGVVGHGRRGSAWHGAAHLGWVWRGIARQAQQGFAGRGWAGLGVVGCGSARHGIAGTTFIFNKEKIMNEERKYLEQMARRNNGVLMIDDVLQAAQDEDNILHRHFEWDDTEAAKQFRREQARSLIQRCKITVLDSTPTHVRAFISLPSDRESGGGYRMTANVLGNEDMKEEFMHDIQLTIARWTKKLHLLDIDLAKLIVQLENEIKHREFEKETEARV